MIRFEIGNCEYSTFILFQECFGYFAVLEHAYKFSDQLVSFGKEVSWDLEGTLLTLLIILEGILILTIVS